MPWVAERYGFDRDDREPERQSGWASQLVAPTPPSVQAAPAGWAASRAPAPKRGPAPMDVFGIPEDAQVSFGTRFFEELPGAVRDLGTTILGPAGGPQSTPEQMQVYRDTQSKVGRELLRGVQRVADKQHEYLVPRTIGQAAMQASATIQNMILRPLGWAGVAGADDAADRTNRVINLLAADDSRETAKSWLAQNLGQGVARGAESILNSVTQAALTGGAGKGVMSAQKAMMFFFGAQSADRAITEGRDQYGLQGKQLTAYAAGMGALEAALMWAGGRVAKGLGVDTAEEALARGLRPQIQNLLTRTGVKESLARLPRATLGAAIEADEEGLTQLTQNVWKAVFTGDDDGILDRVVAALKNPQNQMDVGFATAVGAGSRTAIGVGQSVASGVEAAVRQLPAMVQRARDAVGGARVPAGPASTAEAPAAPAPPTASPPVSAPAPVTAPAAPGAAAEAAPTAPAAPVVPGVEEHPPVVEGAPPVAPPRVPPSETERLPPQGAPPVAIKNARMEQLSREFERVGNSAYSPQRRQFRESAQMAIERGVPENALSIATAVKKQPRQLDDVETAGLNVRLVELRAQRRAVAQSIAQAVESGEGAQVQFLAGELEGIGQEFDVIYDATIRAGTEQGRAFAARRWSLDDDDLDILSTIGRYRASKGSALTPQERSVLENTVERHEKTDAALTTEIRKQDEQLAEKFIEKAKKQRAESPENVAALYVRLKELLAQNCDLE